MLKTKIQNQIVIVIVSVIVFIYHHCKRMNEGPTEQKKTKNKISFLHGPYGKKLNIEERLRYSDICLLYLNFNCSNLLNTK